jgi:hypothetical protein
VCQRAHAIAETEGDLSLQVQTRHILGNAYCVGGDYRRGTALLWRNIEALAAEHRDERFGMPWPPAIGSRAQLARYLADVGRFAEALTLGQEATRIAEQVGQPYALLVAYASIG